MAKPLVKVLTDRTFRKLVAQAVLALLDVLIDRMSKPRS